ncbi:12318_t:CDS:1 [Acaulospora morrowiae]|uniref:12318_t:CDS:1 n=1 Tax=Acaulospora morrowiae TaxID=94023 RepID=A0A9N9D0M0_9GLOM|nr:12318_t:CDS:1 [Acaulospora morrowiae]
MALLSDNNYYLKKLIFASNLIYISRVLNYLKDAYFYYINMKSYDYKSLIVVFINGICDDWYWEGLVGNSQFRRIYLLVKYGARQDDETKLVVKYYPRIGRILKFDDKETPEIFNDQPKAKVYDE